ncbi:MAG: hypothetical protein GX802_05485 [Clostridiales bacterium]|nr:hypothetical protein [Clostridiales bacterium]
MPIRRSGFHIFPQKNISPCVSRISPVRRTDFTATGDYNGFHRVLSPNTLSAVADFTLPQKNISPCVSRISPVRRTDFTATGDFGISPPQAITTDFTGRKASMRQPQPHGSSPPHAVLSP